MGGLQIAALRLYVAALAIFLILRLMNVPVSFNLKDRYFWLTVVATVVNYIFFHIGLEHTGAANAMVLENTAPFFVLVFLFFFARSSVRPRDILATVIAITGVFLTVYQDFEGAGERRFGDALEIAAGLSWAVFLFASSKAMRASNSTGERLNFLLGIFAFSALLLTPLAVMDTGSPSMNDLFFLLLLGVLPTAMAYYFWYEAAARVSTLTATMMFACSVVFTFINAAMFLGDPVTLLAGFGAVLIVSAVFLTSKDDTQD